jgi:hypothetical protein
MRRAKSAIRKQYKTQCITAQECKEKNQAVKPIGIWDDYEKEKNSE